MSMSNKKVSTSDALANFERVWDCLVAIERIQR